MVEVLPPEPWKDVAAPALPERAMSSTLVVSMVLDPCVAVDSFEMPSEAELAGALVEIPPSGAVTAAPPLPAEQLLPMELPLPVPPIDPADPAAPMPLPEVEPRLGLIGRGDVIVPVPPEVPAPLPPAAELPPPAELPAEDPLPAPPPPAPPPEV